MMGFVEWHLIASHFPFLKPPQHPNKSSITTTHHRPPKRRHRFKIPAATERIQERAPRAPPPPPSSSDPRVSIRLFRKLPKMATDELAHAVAPAPAGGDHSPAFSFSIWPPTQRTRDAVVRRLVETLAGDTILCKRYGAVPAADAEPAARAIEAEAFDAAASTGGAAAASVEEGIEALQFYSKEVSRRLLDFVKSRSADAKAGDTPSEEARAPGAPEAEAAQPAA
jgi:hypothetical protein